MREKHTMFYNVAFKTLCLQPPHIQKPVVFDKSTNINVASTNSSLDAKPEILSQDKEATKCSKSDSVHLEEDNLTYNIWQFGDMKILVRSKMQAMIPDNKSPQVTKLR